MTRDQFISLLRSPSTINLNLVKDLEDITEQFPYFQNAHLLLAKQYHGHENIRFESYLRKASAYAPDRTILHKLINMEPSEVIHMQAEKNPAIEEIPGSAVPVQEVAEIPVTVEEPVKENNVSEAADEVTPTSPALNDANEPAFIPIALEATGEPSVEEDVAMVPDDEIFHPENTVKEEENTPADPMEIINRRLRELNIPHQEHTEIPNDEQTEKKDEINSGSFDKDQSEETIPVNIEERSVAVAETYQEPEPEPVSSKQPIEIPGKRETVKAPVDYAEGEVHSFTEWLKIKSGKQEAPAIIPEYTPEILKAESEPILAGHKKNTLSSPLVEKFIKEEPRIVPLKSEFYSPGNMARQSIVEHEDLISETLGRIYAQQGNLRKAAETYTRLSLKFPEKSAYFASLIEKLGKIED